MLKALIASCLMIFAIGCGKNDNSLRTKTTTLSLFTQSFMPENDLWKEASLYDNGMTEDKFNEIIDTVESVYSPIIKKFGGNLIIERNWTDDTVNAYAYQEGNDWVVAMFGGLAKRPEVTEDGFAMVIAHELGHHLGGYPFYSRQAWPAAIEGNSDYFALLAAARNIWKNDNNSVDEIDIYAKELCNTYINGDDDDLSLCYRQMNAGYSLASLLGSLNNQIVNFDTPDKTIVRRMKETHPNAQCRLDTFIAGTLCQVAWNDDIIPQNKKEMEKQSCISAKNEEYSIMSRPRCWFKP